MESVIETLSKWTKAQRNGVYLLIAALIIAAYAFVFLMPSLSSINTYQSELAQKEQDLNLVKEQVVEACFHGQCQTSPFKKTLRHNK